MDREYKEEGKEQLLSSKLSSKITIPRYSDKFKDIIAKSQLARQQSKPKQAEPQPTPLHTDFFFYRIKSIGVGAHSFVYLVQEEQTHLLLAEKSVTKPHAREIAHDITREIKILLHLNHEHIIKLYHFYATETHLNLLLEFAEDSLFALKQRFTIFKEKEIIEVLRQLLLGLRYLHSKHIVHADVKLQNIMIANGTIKLCDFGLAHLTTQKEIYQSEKERELAQVVGTLEYLPPEYVQGVDSEYARDVWAVGVLAFQMLVGKHPFDGLKESDKWAKLIKNPPEYYFQELKEREKQLGIHSEKVEELTRHIFVSELKRWSAEQLLELPFFSSQKTEVS